MTQKPDARSLRGYTAEDLRREGLMLAEDMDALVRLVERYGAEDVAAWARGVAAAKAKGEVWNGREWGERRKAGRRGYDKQRLNAACRIITLEALARQPRTKITRTGVATEIVRRAAAGDALMRWALNLKDGQPPASAAAILSSIRKIELPLDPRPSGETPE